MLPCIVRDMLPVDLAEIAGVTSSPALNTKTLNMVVSAAVVSVRLV